MLDQWSIADAVLTSAQTPALSGSCERSLCREAPELCLCLRAVWPDLKLLGPLRCQGPAAAVDLLARLVQAQAKTADVRKAVGFLFQETLV